MRFVAEPNQNVFVLFGNPCKLRIIFWQNQLIFFSVYPLGNAEHGYTELIFLQNTRQRFKLLKY